MQKAMWRQKELKSLQNVALVDERISSQMTAAPSSIHTSGLNCWHIRHSLNFPARPLGRITVIDKLGLAPACRLLHTITTQHEEPGHNMFAAVCRSQLLRMHFLWLSAVVVRDWSSSSNGVSGCHQCQSGPAEPWEQNPNFTQVTASPARRHTAVYTPITWSVMGISK